MKYSKGPILSTLNLSMLCANQSRPWDRSSAAGDRSSAGGDRSSADGDWERCRGRSLGPLRDKRHPAQTAAAPEQA